ncbi:hypothetical protein AGMMS49921_10780 [Endomicrobiia bacterium]|nr:hypothetical protein AGMMS49921_10780 [Endomicrobiia bacterium]
MTQWIPQEAQWAQQTQPKSEAAAFSNVSTNSTAVAVSDAATEGSEAVVGSVTEQIQQQRFQQQVSSADSTESEAVADSSSGFRYFNQLNRLSSLSRRGPQQQADSTNKTDLAGTEAAVEDAVPAKTGSMDAGSAVDSDPSD